MRAGNPTILMVGEVSEYLLKQNKECINKYEMLQHKYEMLQMATGVYDSETENTFEDIKQILV